MEHCTIEQTSEETGKLRKLGQVESSHETQQVLVQEKSMYNYRINSLDINFQSKAG